MTLLSEKGDKMKLQGLNEKDFTKIDAAFRMMMSEQAKQIKGWADCGAVEQCRDFINDLSDSLETYEKIQRGICYYTDDGKKAK